MQLEELQKQWQRLDEKIERTLKVDRELLRLAVLQPARRRVNRGSIWPALDIAFCLAVMLFTGSFLGHHWKTWSLAGLASVVMIAALTLLIDGIRRLNSLSEIDWSGAAVDIQSSLSRLHIAKLRQVKWILLLSPLVGFCGLIVGLQWLLDRLPEPHFILDKLDPWWVAGNFVFGVLFIPFGHAVVRFFANRLSCHGWWQRLLIDISGSSMKKTRDELERWASLDDDERMSNDTD